jgi:predicted secreted protein
MVDKSVNLDEVNRLVAKLEADLEAGSTDVATLRTELAELRAALGDEAPSQVAVKQGLEGLQERLKPELYDDVVATNYYLAWVGRILGL